MNKFMNVFLRIITPFFLVIVFSSCSGIDKKTILGNYKIDKFVYRDSTVKVKEYPFLSLKDNDTFKLLSEDKKEYLEGKWSIVDDKNKSQVIIEFIFSDKKIKGLLKGNIFYFDYPNDFYSGKYESLLYVKLRK